ncbi:hypothetical protein [Azotosporobacter soli]|uniref:hypothetical protein n=1 Tax=Azotosporobacter soli TaxID=3055040 RepID=UPI0031FED9CC
MKKWISAVLFSLFVILGSATAFAEEAQPELDAKPAKPVVATIYINNAKSTYDAELSKSLSDRFNGKMTSFTLQNDPKFVDKLNKVGVTDISMAERDDILQAFAGENIDYIVYAEIQPPILNSWISMFNQGVKATVTVPVKIIDVKGHKYLYNGKFTETADNSAVFGGVGTKAAVVKALDQIFVKTDAMLINRLPIK